MQKFLLTIFLIILSYSIRAQVGIGTNTPDASAALDIVASANDKGVLIPRLTRAQRNAISSPATGLLIYQTDNTAGLYYFNGSNWIGFGEVRSVNGQSPSTVNGNVAITLLPTQTGTQAQRTATVSLTDGLIHIVTGDPTPGEDGKVYIYSTATSSWNITSAFTDSDEQDISGSTFNSTTNQLTIGITGGMSQTLSLSTLANTDSQTLTLSGTTLSLTNGGAVTLSSGSTNTDSQTLSLAGQILTISGGNSVTLADSNTDTQTLSLVGQVLSISAGNSVTLTDTNTDSQTLSLAGQILTISAGNSVTLAETDSQTLSLAGQILTISGGNSVTLADSNTDTQTLSLAGNVLAISGGNSVTLTQTDSQTLSLVGQVLSISAGNSVTLTDTNTDSQTLTLAGQILTISAGNSVTLAETDSQTLSLAGQILTISGGNSVTLADSNTDTQTLSLAGNVLAISGGNSVTLTETDSQTLSLVGQVLSISAGNSVTLTDTNTDSQTLSLAGQILTISGGNSVTLADSNTDTQTLSLAGNVLTISGGNSVTITETDSQTLSLVGQVLSISAGNSVTLTDTNTDSQTLTLAGQVLTISAGNSVTLADTNTDTQTLNFISDVLTISGGNSVTIRSLPFTVTDGNTLAWNGITNQWNAVNDLRVPVAVAADPIQIFKSLVPANSTAELGQAANAFEKVFTKEIRSDTSSLVFNTGVTSLTVPQIVFEQGSTQIGGFGQNRFFLGNFAGGDYYIFPSTTVGANNNDILTYNGSNALNFSSIQSLEQQDLDDVVSNGGTTTRTVAVGNLSVDGDLNASGGDINLGTSLSNDTIEIGNSNLDTVVINATLSSTLEVANSAVNLGTNSQELGTVYVQNIDANSADLEFKRGGNTFAGIDTSNNFFIGATSATGYSFPRFEPATVGNQVLAYTSSNTLDFLTITQTDSQTLSLSGQVLTISGGNSVTLADTNTDSQTISASFTSNTLNLWNQGTTSSATIDLSSLANTDTQTLAQVTAQGTITTDAIQVAGLTVSGTTGLTVGEAGDQFIFPTTQGTAGQVLTVSTTTGELVFADKTTNTDSQTIAAALNGTTLELRPENITTASITVDLSSLAVTPTLDQVTDVGSITTNNIQVGDLTTTGLTVGNYTFPASNTFGANVALVSTATDTIGFRPFVNIPSGTNDGDILFWNSLGANWERTDILKVPISGAIEVDETFRPRTNGDKLLGTSSYVFSETYSKAFRSGSSAMEIKTGVTSGSNPALSILESSTLVAGVALQTFFIGDFPGGTGYTFPTTKGTMNQVLIQGGSNLLFEDISNLERQTLDDVVTLGNSTTSTVNLGTTNIDGELHAGGGNHSIGDSTTDEDIDIGGSTDDTVSIIGKINQSVLVSGTVEFGDSTNNISTVYTQDIRSNNVSLTLQTTGGGANIVFKPETIEVAGVTSQTFYIGDAAASDRYEFPSNAPATVGNQVLAYTSSNTLTFIDNSSTDSQTLAQVTAEGATTTRTITVGGMTSTGDVSIEGNTTLGDFPSDSVAFNGKVSTEILPINSTITLGDASNIWNSLFVKQIRGNATETSPVSIRSGNDYVAGITTDTFYIGDLTGSDYYKFPAGDASPTAGQVLTVSSTTTELFFSTIPTLPFGMNEGNTLRWNATANEWERTTDLRIAPGSGFSPINAIWINQSLIPSSTSLNLGQTGNEFGIVQTESIHTDAFQLEIELDSDNSQKTMWLGTTGSSNNNLALTNNQIIYGNNNTIFGINVMEDTFNHGSDNTGFGFSALQKLTNGGDGNTAFGSSALNNITTGDNNLALGYQPLTNLTTGVGNIAIGYRPMYNSGTGVFDNIAIGEKVLEDVRQHNNIGIGKETMLQLTSGRSNVGIGYQAKRTKTAGDFNIALGYQAAYQSEGNNNIALGQQALYGFSGGAGDNNVAIGTSSLYDIDEGDNNIGIGNNAGNTITAGADNILIGTNADVTSDSVTNTIGIGKDVSISNSNEIRIGNSDHTLTVIGGTSIVPISDNTANLGASDARWKTIFSWNAVNVSSDRRLKSNIKDLNYGLKEVMALKPKTFHWIDNDNGKRLGFIAQDLLEIIPEVVVNNKKSNTLSVYYTEVIPVLTKAIQEQQAQIEAQQQQLNMQATEIETLKTLVQQLIDKQK